MSGRKHSRISMQSAWLRRQQQERLAEQLNAIRNNVNSLLQKITAAGSEQLQTAFRSCRDWLDRQANAASSNIQLDALQAVIEQGDAVARQASTEFQRVQQLRLSRIQARIRDCDVQLAHSQSAIERHRLQPLAVELENPPRTPLGIPWRMVVSERPNATPLSAEEKMNQLLIELTGRVRAEQISAQRQRLAGATNSANALATTASAILQDSTAGARKLFAEDVQRVENWLSAVSRGCSELERTANVDDAVEGLATQFEGLSREGSPLVAELKSAMIEKLAERRGQALAAVQALTTDLNQNQDRLNQWNMAAEMTQIQQRIKKLNDILLYDNFADFDSEQADVATQVRNVSAAIQVNESKHQTRIEVLRGLRQVCADMGFGEVAPPQSLRDGDRSAPIILLVDTYDRGRIRFALTLDQIESDSDVSEQHCFEEFDSLSQRLRESFGIETQFECAGTLIPRRIRKNEKETPDGGGATTTGSESQQS